ncbi:hypothetical protein Dimus_004473 [Dionaea muscipula]
MRIDGWLPMIYFVLYIGSCSRCLFLMSFLAGGGFSGCKQSILEQWSSYACNHQVISLKKEYGDGVLYDGNIIRDFSNESSLGFLLSILLLCEIWLRKGGEGPA